MKAAILCLCLAVAYAQDTTVAAPTDAPTSGAASVWMNATAAPTETCFDKKDCTKNNMDSCIGLYRPYAEENCARWCGFCQRPEDINPPCKNAIDICANYPQDLCTNDQYRLFVEENCRLYCNATDPKWCDFRPRYIQALEKAPATTVDPNVATQAPHPDCVDKLDVCWTEPDSSCFGLYEPWSRANCPFRCGFCDVKPACVDEQLYCALYGPDLCTNSNFTAFARKNCRKTCNMCALPVRPSDVPVTDPGQGGVIVAPPSQTGQVNPVLNTTGNGDQGLPGGMDLVGQKATFIIQGAPFSDPNVCFYKGKARALNSFWYDGCDYMCQCFDPARNRVICTERCVRWGTLPDKLAGECSLIKEADDCCEKIECNA